jgi:hypothetical protein
MLRSRLLSINQPLFQRTLVTKAKTVINNKQDEQHKGADEYRSSNTSFNPPRRPLTEQFTHQVTNQVPPIEHVDFYETDLTFREFVSRENSGQMGEMAAELGAFHWFEQGHRANRHPPTLHQFDRFGQRIDEVHFHPAYHDLMQIGMRYGVSYSSKIVFYSDLYE